MYDTNHSGPITDNENLSLRSHYHPQENPENNISVGFKLMYDQLVEYGYLTNLFREESCRIIHFIRKNDLKIYLSKLTRRKRGIAHSVINVDKIKVWVDALKIIDFLNEIVEMKKKMKLIFSQNPYIEITYEDFLQNYNHTSQEIFKFLDVATTEVRLPVLKKLNPESTRDIITNYDEISEVLKGSSFEMYLD